MVTPSISLLWILGIQTQVLILSRQVPYPLSHLPSSVSFYEQFPLLLFLDTDFVIHKISKNVITGNFDVYLCQSPFKKLCT